MAARTTARTISSVLPATLLVTVVLAVVLSACTAATPDPPSAPTSGTDSQFTAPSTPASPTPPRDATVATTPLSKPQAANASASLPCNLSLGSPAQSVTSESLVGDSFVDTQSGNYVYARTDIATGTYPGVVFMRTYNSRDTRVTSMGPGWRHSYDIRIENPDDDTGPIVLIGPNSRTERHTRGPDGKFLPPPVSTITLTKNADGTYTATHQDGTQWLFRTDGKLAQIVDRRGEVTRLHYGASGDLERIDDPAGRGSLTLSYDPQTKRLVSVTDWLTPPRMVRYLYDDLGRLVGVVDREEQTTRFAYDGISSRLATITDARGHDALTIKYDEYARVTERRDSRGQVRTIEYVNNADGTQVSTHQYPPSSFDPQWRTTMVDTYDTLGRIVRRETRYSSTEPPQIEEYAYDAQYRRTAESRVGSATPRPPGTPIAIEDLSETLAWASTSAPDQSVRTLYRQMAHASSDFACDEFGRLKSFTGPLGAFFGGSADTTIAVQIRYDREDRPRFAEFEHLEQGVRRVLEYRYDAVGNLVEVIPPVGIVSRYTYNEADALVEAWLPSQGIVARYEYDDRGYVSRVRLEYGGGAYEEVIDYAFDGLQRLRRIVEYLDWPNTESAIVTEFSYDTEGNPSAYQYERP